MVNIHQKVQFKLNEGTQAILPTRATDGSCGYDLYLAEDLDIFVGDTVTTNLQLSSAIPNGFGAFIIPRSGLGTKLGMRLANTIGLIDSDYRGDWHLVFNLNLEQSSKGRIPHEIIYGKNIYTSQYDTVEELKYIEDTMLNTHKEFNLRYETVRLIRLVDGGDSLSYYTEEGLKFYGGHRKETQDIGAKEQWEFIGKDICVTRLKATLKAGTKIAQFTIQRCENFELEVVNELTETVRGAGGFGSTGIK